jgi:hypothetical protein
MSWECRVKNKLRDNKKISVSNRRKLRENVNAKKTKCNKILDTKTADFHKLSIYWNGTIRRLQ